MNTDGTGLTQLTHMTTGTGAVTPRWTPDGGVVVFTSDNDLTGSNPDQNFEVFRMNVDGSALVQLTSTAGQLIGSRAWSITPDAKTIGIHSPLDLVPGANPERNFEIFVTTFSP